MTAPLPTWADWQDRAEALGLQMRSGELVGPCPSCGGTDRFHVKRRGSAALVGCRGCIDGGGRGFGTVLREVFPERGPGRPGSLCEPRAVETGKPPCTVAHAMEYARCEASRRFARRVWQASRPIVGTVAAAYLDARGVGHVAGALALRFHPGIPHPSVPGRFPALIAGVQDVAGDFMGVQRCYLDGARKAALDLVRASLGSLAGGAVRLTETAGGGLLVGEGIETTAAAALVLEWYGGAWAALGAPGLKAVVLPADVHDVVIAADRDAGGLRAAAALARRLEGEGRTVEIWRPERGDFNDVLCEASA